MWQDYNKFQLICLCCWFWREPSQQAPNAGFGSTKHRVDDETPRARGKRVRPSYDGSFRRVDCIRIHKVCIEAAEQADDGCRKDEYLRKQTHRPANHGCAEPAKIADAF